MPGGTKRGKKGHARARPRRPALGNDPFERGAAPREPAAPSPRTPPPPPPSPRPAGAEAAVAVEAASARVSGLERRLDVALDGVEARLQGLAERAGIAAA